MVPAWIIRKQQPKILTLCKEKQTFSKSVSIRRLDLMRWYTSGFQYNGPGEINCPYYR